MKYPKTESLKSYRQQRAVHAANCKFDQAISDLSTYRDNPTLRKMSAKAIYDAVEELKAIRGNNTHEKVDRALDGVKNASQWMNESVWMPWGPDKIRTEEEINEILDAEFAEDRKIVVKNAVNRPWYYRKRQQ